jgi:hypothetical protein
MVGLAGAPHTEMSDGMSPTLLRWGESGCQMVKAPWASFLQ